MAAKKVSEEHSKSSNNKLVTLNVLDIYLDSQNPRHPRLADQQEIISYLLKKERVRNLARDIAKEGISPIDLFAVIRDQKGNYIAVEGNRRICALMLLNDPEAAPEPDRKYFKKLASDGSRIPTQVGCIEFDSRDAADAWILRRHGGEMDGVGTKQWDASQIARHKVGKDKQNYNALALSIIDYAVSEGHLPKEGSEKILTTVTRYLGNPYLRKILGIVSGRSDSDVVINVTYDDFDRAIQKFFSDLKLPNSPISSRSNKDDWETYAAKLINDGYAPGQHSDKRKLSEKSPVERQDATRGAAGGTGSKKTGLGGNSGTRSPDKRSYIVPSEFRPPLKNKILRRVLGEMKSISVDDYPLAVSLLTRAFLENIYSEYHGKFASYITVETHVLLGKVIKIIEGNSDISKAEVRALGALRRVQSNENNVFSPKTLGANAHASHYPNATELKREWDNVSAILDYMLRGIS